MGYLPTSDVVRTEFPSISEKDYRMQLRQTESLWNRMCPQRPYYALKQAATVQSDVSRTSGESGTTQIDPLYGETVPGNDEKDWEQPHGDSTPDAASVEKFADPVWMPMRIEIGSKDLSLKKYGFDKVRPLVVHIPLIILDQHDVTVQAGDVIGWDGDQYLVKDFTRSGYLWNTNVRLYMTMNCDHKREGS